MIDEDNFMKTEDVKQIIDDNARLVNIGGHFFEGTTKHNRRTQGLPQMSDLVPFEEQGLIRRVHGYDGIGKRYVSAFVSNAKSEEGEHFLIMNDK
jgi:hypothetical protein